MQIIYIAGSGRSGSTLLDMIIGTQPGAFSSGELCNLISAYLSSEYCACGSPLDRCCCWKSIIDAWKIENDLSQSEIEKFARLDRFYSHPKKVRAWLFGLLPVIGKQYKWYLELLESLYEKISSLTGSCVVTDSSKSPVRLLHLNKFVKCNLTVIHLIKSPYGIIESLSKTWNKDKARGVQKKIQAKKPFRTAVYWLVINYMVEFSVWFSRRSCFRMKYEDLTSCPEETLKPIFHDFKMYEPLSGGHISAGNRMRLSREVYVRPVEKKKKSSSFLVNLVLRMAMSRYGY
ncbi:hypothetical protein CVH10_00280 [Halomonas sp. ND22Bw]|uniref:sulfotransferase n=1 Tax=Halomonas sp. ND22Bw TaxID=2054178 RepID=UPI000D0B1536|nr:hypothetical protein CVH10_00280 [Halomonas sp. ND22Bw]